MASAEVQEIHCKTLLNKIDVPGFPFRWTMNPYRRLPPRLPLLLRPAKP